MAYILYTIFLFSIIIGTIVYLTRARWMPLMPDKVQSIAYSALPTTFMGDIESGFTSNDFDLSGNVMEGDSRAGLDQKGKRDVQRLMKTRGISFDEARRVYTEQRFKQNNIGADGVPRDPKFVSFS